MSRTLLCTFLAVGCTGGTVTVFDASGQMTTAEQREWFRHQRESRAAYDERIQACLSAPVPSLPEAPAEEFQRRVHRTQQSTNRALQECKQDVGATSLSGKLSLAVSYSPEGAVLAARVIEARTDTGNAAFNECVRSRFCFLKGWPGEGETAGEIYFHTQHVP